MGSLLGELAHVALQFTNLGVDLVLIQVSLGDTLGDREKDQISLRSYENWPRTRLTYLLVAYVHHQSRAQISGTLESLLFLAIDDLLFLRQTFLVSFEHGRQHFESSEWPDTFFLERKKEFDKFDCETSQSRSSSL